MRDEDDGCRDKKTVDPSQILNQTPLLRVEIVLRRPNSTLDETASNRCPPDRRQLRVGLDHANAHQPIERTAAYNRRSDPGYHVLQSA